MFKNSIEFIDKLGADTCFQDYIDLIKSESDTEYIKVLSRKCQESFTLSEEQIEYLNSVVNKQILKIEYPNNRLPWFVW